MATIINTPGSDNGGSGSAAGWVIAVIILILVILFGIFVWPGINGGTVANTTAPVGTAPASGGNGLGGVLNVTSTTTNTNNNASGTPTTSTTTTTTVTPL